MHRHYGDNDADSRMDVYNFLPMTPNLTNCRHPTAFQIRQTPTGPKKPTNGFINKTQRKRVCQCFEDAKVLGF